MRNETRIAYNGYLAQVAKLNGVDSAAVKFNVEPSVQQNLETAIQESTALLGRINVIGVMEQSGEALLLGVNGPIASRTDTAGGNRRNPGENQALSKDDYTCKQTNFDSAFRYVLLDAWAKFPDFQTRLTAAIAQRQALDRLMIGWNGVSAAAATNAATYPLRQDVNIGWLQKIRTKAPDRVLDEGATVGKVTVGAAGDYKTLDGLVFDAVQMLDPWHRSHPDLIVIVSRNLMHEKLLAAVEKGATSNQEENAAQEIVTRARLGGLLPGRPRAGHHLEQPVDLLAGRRPPSPPQGRAGIRPHRRLPVLQRRLRRGRPRPGRPGRENREGVSHEPDPCPT